MSNNIRLLIADDQQVFREGLRALFEKEEDFTIVGEAMDGSETIRKFSSLDPDVILIDLMGPNEDGINVITNIIKHNEMAKILVASNYADTYTAMASMSNGALGYTLKETSFAALLDGIKKVCRGEAYFYPPIGKRVNNRIYKSFQIGSDLSVAELKVLKLVAFGYTDAKIAKELNVAAKTVKTHVTHILGKLQLPNRTLAALYAVRENIVSADDGLNQAWFSHKSDGVLGFE